MCDYNEFYFAIYYKEGNGNLHADAMSRLSIIGVTTVKPDYAISWFESSDADKNEEIEFLENGSCRLDCFLPSTSDDNESLLVPITIEFLRSQLNDEFCADIRS